MPMPASSPLLADLSAALVATTASVGIRRRCRACGTFLVERLRLAPGPDRHRRRSAGRRRGDHCRAAGRSHLGRGGAKRADVHRILPFTGIILPMVSVPSQRKLRLPIYDVLANLLSSRSSWLKSFGMSAPSKMSISPSLKWNGIIDRTFGENPSSGFLSRPTKKQQAPGNGSSYVTMAVVEAISTLFRITRSEHATNHSAFKRQLKAPSGNSLQGTLKNRSQAPILLKFCTISNSINPIGTSSLP